MLIGIARYQMPPCLSLACSLCLDPPPSKPCQPPLWGTKSTVSKSIRDAWVEGAEAHLWRYRVTGISYITRVLNSMLTERYSSPNLGLSHALFSWFNGQMDGSRTCCRPCASCFQNPF